MRPMFLSLFNKNQLFLIETLTKIKTLGKSEGELKNGQSTGTGNIRHTRHRTKKNKTGRTTKMSNADPTGGETKMSNTDPTKHWWWNQDEQHGLHQTLVVKPRWATWTPTKHWWWNQNEEHRHHQALVVKPRWATRTPPSTGGATKMSNTNSTKHLWWN